MTECNSRPTTGTVDISTKGDAKLKRSREYRRLYVQRKNGEKKELEQRFEETKTEIERLRLEQEELISQSHALSGLCTYSNSMIEALSAAATATAAKARSLCGRAVEGVDVFRDWAERQWNMFPTIEELVTGSFWAPPDDLLRWFLKRTTPEYIFSRNPKFIERLAHLLEEGQRSPDAYKHAEMKISYLINVYVS